MMGLSYYQVRHLVLDGKLPYRQFNQKKLIPREAVEKFIEEMVELKTA